MTETLPIRYEALKNRCAIVTGGASGLGLATATRWAEHGAYVTLVDQNEEEGKAAAADLTGKGYKVSFVACDTRDWNSSVAAFKHAVTFSPRKTLDYAALYAGIGGDADNLFNEVAKASPQPSIDEDPVELPTRIVDVNLLGVIKSTKLALHYFRLPAAADAPAVSSGSKSLFLCASLAGYVDYIPTNYCVSKYGVRGLFRSLRRASQKPENNFSVNLVAPGYTLTPLVTKFNPGDGARQQAIERAIANNLTASIESVVDCATLSVTNEDVNGRSFATVPRGYFDMQEELAAGYGGEKLREEMEISGYTKAGVTGD